MTDKETVFRALGFWKGYIETGVFGGMDKATILKLANGDKDMKRTAQELPELTIEQQGFVDRLTGLQKKLLGG